MNGRDSCYSNLPRDELVNLRSVKPLPGERKEIELVPPPAVTAGEPVEAKADAGSVSLMDRVEDDSPTNEAASEQLTTEKGAAGGILENSVEEEKKGEDENADNDSDSDEAVGHEQAAEEDRNLDDDDKNDEDSANDVLSTPGTVSEMFQRLLSMSGATGSSGQFSIQPSSQIQGASPGNTGTDGNSAYTFSASALHGGRMICTLPDHPIHAGATAVVAVIIEKKLMVANAGDSRAVLCRDGAAFALSYDHKPQQEREMGRIRRAGGFVNQFGRVNGNLNLSRSVGDLKYKQAHFLPPAEQMITAEPDVLE